jgi:hypothetical protein
MNIDGSANEHHLRTLNEAPPAESYGAGRVVRSLTWRGAQHGTMEPLEGSKGRIRCAGEEVA